MFPDAQAAAGLAEEERQRADLYVLLARLLIVPPNDKMLEALRRLKGGEGALGEALAALAAMARTKSAAAIDDEFHTLFIGLDEGELVPYASYYLEGALYAQPLSKLRGDMARRGIAWIENVKEPEDHIAALCEMMAGLILGAFGNVPASLDDQRGFYDAHIAPWADDFFADLERAEGAVFYRPVAQIGRTFLAIESKAFQLTA